MARRKKTQEETTEELNEFIEGAKSKKARTDEAKKVELDPGRARALEQTLSTILKRFGEGSIMRLGEATHMKIDTIPTGSLAIDLALGVGGIPRGRVTEI
jgi:recombination protein RecA